MIPNLLQICLFCWNTLKVSINYEIFWIISCGASARWSHSALKNAYCTQNAHLKK